MKIIIVPCIPKMFGRRYNLAKTFAAQGHDVIYISWELPYGLNMRSMIRHMFTSLKHEEYEYENFTVHKIRRLPFFWPYVNGWLFKYQLNKIYKKLDADFVFSQSYTNETEIPKNLPLLYDLNDDHVAMAEVYGSLFYKLAFRLLRVRAVIRRQCQRAFCVTVVSDPLNEIALKHNENVVVLENGINTKLIKSINSVQNKVKKNSLVYVTGFNQWSRPIETIEAVVKLKNEYKDLTLTLIGDGTETQSIKSYIRENELEDYIYYMGAIYNQNKLFKIVARHQVGLAISEKNKLRDAAFPLKIIEYSSLAKPIVSTNLNEVNALKFPNIHFFSNPESLKGTIKNALEDTRNYTKFSVNVLDKYDWNKIADKVIYLFKEYQIINTKDAKV
jgi:glycosyltransferase involved in cell wall biosynthesis